MYDKKYFISYLEENSDDIANKGFKGQCKKRIYKTVFP